MYIAILAFYFELIVDWRYNRQRPPLLSHFIIENRLIKWTVDGSETVYGIEGVLEIARVELELPPSIDSGT